MVSKTKQVPNRKFTAHIVVRVNFEVPLEASDLAGAVAKAQELAGKAGDFVVVPNEDIFEVDGHVAGVDDTEAWNIIPA